MKSKPEKSTVNHSFLDRMNDRRLLLVVLAVLAVVYAFTFVSSEPFFNNDETRHVMTGVYFRDALHDMPLTNLRTYTINYYLQYPALGLLVWPPFFYFVEGLFMSVFGTSIIVSKALIVGFAVMAFVYFFYLVRRTHCSSHATAAVVVLALSPLIFVLTHQVMLEVPTLALGLATTFHFLRYLEADRRRDLILAGLFAAFAALTRFDAIYLLPLFLILLVARRRLRIVLRKEVIIVAALALLVVAPAYAFSASGIGWMHLKFATQTLSADVPAFLSFTRLGFYPSTLLSQLGLVALIPAVIALVARLTFARSATTWPYFALVLATYLTFTPLGELESRHAIYWLPAFAFFAADGLYLVAERLRARKLYLPLASLLVIAMGWSALAGPRLYFRGYQEAARFVVENTKSSPYCFFVGDLNGDFIYQIRRHDVARRLWVLRADKLLFSVLIVPGGEAQQFAESEQEILDTIFEFDPEFLVVEDPRWLDQGAPSEEIRRRFQAQIRGAIRNHPERFKLETEITVDSSEPEYHGTRIQIFRNILRNDQPRRHLELQIQMLRRSLEADVP